MPKVTMKAKPSGPSKGSAAGGAQPSVPAKSNKSASAPTKAGQLYSNFLPIPLLLSSPTPIPSSSSKPLTTIGHHVPREDTVRGESPGGPGSAGGEGTICEMGVVESVEIGSGSGSGGGDVLEQAVKGLPLDEDSEDDEDEDEEEEGKDGEQDGEPRAEPRFMGTGEAILPRAKRSRKKKDSLPASVPDVIPLPPTDPRSTPLGPSGLRTAHITYLDAVSVSRALSYTGGPISLSTTSAIEPIGLEYYLSLHSALRPSLAAVKEFADSSMARFDHLHSLLLSSRAKQAGAGALVDEDGFTVVRDGKGAMGVGVAKRGFEKELANKKKSKAAGSGELVDFYKFQKVDRKRQELADLRAKFEEDKKKVDEMRRTKRFKPY
ncbi:Ribosomal RNA-processing protein 7 [Saitozyma podzolica]|uniref:Ribosomal RNA-processing protein 7 n=1 Tax=Saitozyma podzolica TaxID=1890683 RepID=A0A427XTM6_9TREE|nr:Ribosomal RNA-processing protein 7 [Saitozyma podzolica]